MPSHLRLKGFVVYLTITLFFGIAAYYIVEEALIKRSNLLNRHAQ
jgi:hypothetical protein